MLCPSCKTPVEASQRYCFVCGTALPPPALAETQAADVAGARGVGASAAQNSMGDAATPETIIGQTLGGKYKVVRLLGEGGMGAVYEGEQQLGTTKRKVAVKTLHPHLSRDPKIKARFEREVGTVAELEHPNTIQVYDFGSNAEGILYIVMEFLQGKSLAQVLEQGGAMVPDRVQRIMQQVCGSLEEAHGRGIVHRDLKPDNVVLVDRAGKKDFVKVLDFGIAKRSNEEDKNEQKLTQQGTVLGTPPYMSPEQFTGRPIDARSDIYSLGLMAYEMLTGRLPFEANTAWEWATQHMTQAPRPMESLAEGMRAPAAMRDAVKKALAKAPDERFQTVTEFAEAFSGARSDQGAAAHAAIDAARRQKTELGAPLDLAAAFGASVASPADAAPVGQGYSPAGSHVPFHAPAAIPHPPPREGSRGGGRTALLAAAGLIGVVSIGAIVFAMRGSSGGGKAVVFDQGASSAQVPAAAAASNSTSGETTTPADTGESRDVPPLVGGRSHTVPRPAAPHSSAAPGAIGQVQGPVPSPPPGPSPPAPSPPTPKPPKYDGPECQTARRLTALGHAREAESWASACVAKGGTVMGP
jgi:serine/threonine-protein kinase